MSPSLFFLFTLVACTAAIDNGVARVAPRGWSSWNTFRYGVSQDLIIDIAESVTTTGLFDAGYEYILIDDGWTACLSFSAHGGCLEQAPRVAANGYQIPYDTNKFPDGMQFLTEKVHSLGLKIGIYTAVSNATCGGFVSSLGYEALDAQTFADWGFDFVKHDTCNYDCTWVDNCIRNATTRMRDGLNATGRPMVYYIDDGNSSSGTRLYNPLLTDINHTLMSKIATVYNQIIWYWGPETANMWKFWFDIEDRWTSTIDNAHRMAGAEMFQSCGSFNTPDMITVGQGGQTHGEYRTQFFLWSVFGSPLILGADVRQLDNDSLSLLTAPEVLSINQDPLCVQASLTHHYGGGEVWVKPLSTGEFAAALVNTAMKPQNITLWITSNTDIVNSGDFYPAVLNRTLIRDVHQQADLGVFHRSFTVEVPGHDAVLVKVTPLP